MKTVPVSSIIVPPDRQRQSFEPAFLLELAQSIHTRGLFHALQVRPGTLTLVTGENRLRAIREHLIPLGKTFSYGGEPVPPGHVPIIEVSSSDPLEWEEIELEENAIRRDLTWQERAEATSRLHLLRAAQKARAAVELNQPIPPQTVAETALEVRGSAVGYPHTTTRDEIIVAQHLDKPEVAKAANLKDALKAIKRIEDADRNRALAALVGETFSHKDHEAYNVDCLDWMGDPAEAGRFDVILTDPPYGMGAQNFGDGAGRLAGIEHHYDDSYESWQGLMTEWCMLSYRVTKPQAHAYVFCDIDRFHELKGMMEEHGWYVFRTPLINVKTNSGRVPLPNEGPRRQYEICLYAIKGKKPVTATYSDVITSELTEGAIGHGAQKPVSLYQDLLRRSVRPGDTVLDSFSGSGTIFPAAHEFKVKAVGLEQNPEYYAIGLKRLEALGAQKELL